MISEFALFVFTTLGGLGAGLYAMAAVFPVEDRKKSILITALPLVLLAAGGVALLMHLGRPERMLNAFANPSAGITQEGIAVGLFGIVVLIDLICTAAKKKTPRALRVVGGVLGVVLCLAMSLAYYSYEAVAAWHAFSTIMLFLIGSLAAGAVLFGALNSQFIQQKEFRWTCVVLVSLTALAFVAECATFAGLGMGIMPFVVAIVLDVVALVFLLIDRPAMVSWRYWAAFAAVFVAVAIARYAFYSVI